MKKSLSLFLLSLVAPLLLSAPLVLADTKSAIQCGVNAGAGETGCSSSGAGVDVTELITTVINILSVLTGALAVIMIIIAGFRYVTSGGSDAGVAAAKKTLMYALIGLVVVSLAQVIVHFVLNNFTK
jgi:hypothetical protein